MTNPVNRCGFTLIEILLAVATVALLAVLIVPAVNMALRSRQNAQAASKLRTAAAAFEMYRSEMGSYPADKTPGVVPPEMAGYFSELNIDEWWSSPTELGGQWDWDEFVVSGSWSGHNGIISVSIAAPTKASSQLIEFDQLIDDGNLNTGKFRKVDAQYHYILN